jgi:PAS domain S-box-containing protein
MATEVKLKSAGGGRLPQPGPDNHSGLLDNILSAASIGAGRISNRIFQEVNPFFCDMLGYEPEELLGQSSKILYPSEEDFVKSGEYKYKQIAEYGKGTVETKLRRKDGALLDIRISSVPLNPSDLSAGVLFTAMDITKTKQVERDLSTSRSRSTNLIQTSPMGILIYQLNEAGKLILTEANPAVETILGEDYNGAVGNSILEIFPNLENTEILDSYIKVAETGENWTTTNFQYRDDRIAGAYDILAFRIAHRQVAVMFSDITERKQTEQRLQQSEEKHRKIYQNIQDVYFELDTDTTILDVSPSATKITKYTREELIGKPLSVLSVDDKIKDLFLNLLFKKGELLDFDVPIKDKDGRVIFCSVNVKIEFDINQEPLKIIGSLRDITERRLAREKISKLEMAVEQSPSSVVITNLEGNIEYVNPKFTEVTGYTREEAIGKNPSLLKSGTQEPAFYEELWCTISAGKEWRGEFHNKRKDGSTFWEMASISPIRNQHDEITHFIAIKEDISDRKIWEQQLQEAKEKAEDSDRLKSAFLANMSHEIRTPMNAILGFSELLKHREIPESERQEYINLISTKGNDLMAIISDLIDISRIEAGDMKLSRINISVDELVKEVYEQTKKEKDFRGKDMVQIRRNISTDSVPRILSDKNRLRQVFTNLLSNALKFTHEGFVEIGYETKDDQVHFFVRDTGIGIEPDKHAIIFERFRQADDSQTRRYGGTGLGLAISRQIVELLGGEIWVESNPGQGSTFWFSQSLNEVDRKDDSPPDIAEVYDDGGELNLENRKILIAEDDSSNYLFLESLLGAYKAELIWARDGNQAVEIHKNIENIDLILMDIRMPSLNGLLATEKIRETDKNIPILALTAFAFADDRQKSLEAGCDEHLTKPVKIQELKYMLSKYLG